MTFGFWSCESYLDINENPDQITVVDPQFTLTAGQVDLAYFMAGDYNDAAAFWVHYYTQAGNIAGFDIRDQYDLRPADNRYQTYFTGIYSGPLVSLDNSSKTALEQEDNNAFAVAELLKAYAFQVLVDMFDKVPYSQALLPDEFTNPASDNGDVIYADLVTKIDAALAVIDPSGSVDGDLIFGGDMRKWQQFGNTLKLKIYMRQSEVDPSGAAAGIATLASVDFLEEDAEVLFEQSNPDNRHPADVVNVNSQNAPAASNTMINYLRANTDPRINVFYRAPTSAASDNPTQAHRGIDQGNGSNITGSEASLDFYSARGNFLIGTGSAAVFFSAAEVYFLRAEAALRGWLTGDAQTFYNAGVEASFGRTDVGSSATFTGVGGVYEYPTTGTQAEQLEAIMMQKWVALTGRQGIEMWSEWRRTGYPDTDIIFISPISVLPAGEFPLRFPFIQREEQLNSNAPEFVSLNTPVWWDI